MVRRSPFHLSGSSEAGWIEKLGLTSGPTWGKNVCLSLGRKLSRKMTEETMYFLLKLMLFFFLRLANYLDKLFRNLGR